MNTTMTIMNATKKLVATIFAVGLIAGVAAAGAIGGPKFDLEQTIPYGYQRSYRIAFYGNETARVQAVEVDGDDIDLYIYDANGRLIVKDTDPDGSPVCRWTPNRTQVYTVKVVNEADTLVLFDLETN